MASRVSETIEVPVEVVLVYAKCPECDGKMSSSGSLSRLSDPPQQHHKCESCKFESWLFGPFPKVEYRPLAAQEEVRP